MRRIGEAISYLKQHTLACFPNEPERAAVVRIPDIKDSRGSSRLTSLYYSFEEFAKAGEIDFALEQMRVCWGWAFGSRD